MAAKQGVKGAQFSIGVMLDEGRGVPQNDMLAYKWSHHSSRQGDIVAMSNRGKIEKRLTFSQIEEARKTYRAVPTHKLPELLNRWFKSVLFSKSSNQK